MRKTLYSIFMFLLAGALLSFAFHSEETTGWFDTVIHYVSMPILSLFTILALIGGMHYFEDKYIELKFKKQ